MAQFEDYPISTQTLIVNTNVIIDCQKFYDSIQCLDITKPNNGKKRMQVNSEDNVEIGSIVFAQYKNFHKGMPFKKLSKKHFLNSVTIIISMSIKYINIKVSNKGKLQITGCNKQIHPLNIVSCFWDILKNYPDTWTFQAGQTIYKSSIIPVMSNINFSIGFHINRELLHNIINTRTKYISILETSDGYVGVNIKIEVDYEPLYEILVDEYSFFEENWQFNKIKVSEYIETLSLKEQKKKISKCYINTFLVFYSGKVIMSGGISFINRRKAYEIFMGIIDKYKEEIKVIV